MKKKNGPTGRIFNAKQTCYVSSALKLFTCLSSPPSIVNMCSKSQMTELLRTCGNYIILVRPMKVAGDRYPEAGCPKMSATSEELQEPASQECHSDLTRLLSKKYVIQHDALYFLYLNSSTGYNCKSFSTSNMCLEVYCSFQVELLKFTE